MHVKHRLPAAKKGAATRGRNFRSFLLVEQFDAAGIGRRIAESRRLADGMTQETLADLLGISKRSIQEYEAGHTVPWKHLRGIARLTGQAVEWLIHGSEEDAPETRELLEDVSARLRRLEEYLYGDGTPTRRAGP